MRNKLLDTVENTIGALKKGIKLFIQNLKEV